MSFNEKNFGIINSIKYNKIADELETKYFIIGYKENNQTRA